MTLFYWNSFLALAWALAAGGLSMTNLVIGFVLGYAALWIASPAFGRSRYFARVPKAVCFVSFVLWKIVLANLRVAHDVVTPTYHMQPGFVTIPLEAKTDLEITLLACLITLTPGSLSLDVSDDRNELLMHSMFIDDVEKFRDNIKNGFERRLLDLMR